MIESVNGMGNEPLLLGGCNADADFHGVTRSNATHTSTSDLKTKLYRNGSSMKAKFTFLDRALMENRCGLVVNACLTEAKGHVERPAALATIEKPADRRCSITLGADKGYDASDFVNAAP